MESKTQQYKLDECLGSGDWGTTFICHDENDLKAKRMACKIMLKDFARKQAINNEIHVMKFLNERYPHGHLHLVNFKQVFEDNKAVYIMMDLCDGGNLSKLSKFSEVRARKIMCSLMHAIEACHSVGVMHLDIKPDNILLLSKDKDATDVKLCDFGSSIIFELGGTFIGNARTLGFQGLELYNKEVDLWDAGAVLYYLLSGDRDDHFGGRMTRISWEDISDMTKEDICELFDIDPKTKMIGIRWEDISDMAKEVVCELLDIDPKTRMTVERFFQHPWVTQIKVQLGEGVVASYNPP